MPARSDHPKVIDRHLIAVDATASTAAHTPCDSDIAWKPLVPLARLLGRAVARELAAHPDVAEAAGDPQVDNLGRCRP